MKAVYNRKGTALAYSDLKRTVSQMHSLVFLFYRGSHLVKATNSCALTYGSPIYIR